MTKIRIQTELLAGEGEQCFNPRLLSGQTLKRSKTLYNFEPTITSAINANIRW